MNFFEYVEGKKGFVPYISKWKTVAISYGKCSVEGKLDWNKPWRNGYPVANDDFY